jgi:hypothetical protein
MVPFAKFYSEYAQNTGMGTLSLHLPICKAPARFGIILYRFRPNPQAIRHKSPRFSNISIEIMLQAVFWISELTIFELYHLNGMKKIILLSCVVVGWAWNSGFAQGPMRGEADLQATQKSLEMGLLVEEMEDAGFVLDVTEGFEEDWEESTWISAEGDDLDVVKITHEDAEMFALESDSDVEARIDEESDESLALNSDDDDMIAEDVAYEDESDTEDFTAVEYEEATEEDTNWWNDGNLDASWGESEDEWELEALENSYEDEDMEAMEALFEKS